MKQILKLGTNRKNKRVWLENKNYLEEAGFYVRLPYDATYYPISQSIKLRLDEKGKRRVAIKSGGPVIDLNSTKVGWALGDVDKVKVTYKPGLITIKGVK